MKNRLLISFIAVFLLAGCNSRRNQLNLQTARTWLESKAGAPSINIDGEWEDVAFANWGSPHFRQIGNRVIGAFGLYRVEGVVNGDRVYLILLSDGYLYYTMILSTLTAGKLKGKYISGMTSDENFEGELFVLKRMKTADSR